MIVPSGGLVRSSESIIGCSEGLVGSSGGLVKVKVSMSINVNPRGQIAKIDIDIN